MKRIYPLIVIILVALVGTACSPAGASFTTTTPEAAITEAATVTPIPATSTPEPSVTPTPNYPVEGMGPTGFAQDVDPLTGLKVSDPQLLNRRPVLVKVENIPREDRPQWGLSQADLVFESYTERGSTRFAAVFYGKNAEMVGPVRSARHFDLNVIQMYKAIMLFGSAYEGVFSRLLNNVPNQLVVENQYTCPSLCRYDPHGKNYLMANTTTLNTFLKQARMNNDRQNEGGMFFQMTIPEGGTAINSLFVRYSGAIYNRWDFDAASGKYLRFADTQNDLNNTNEVYTPLVDRTTNQQLAFENVVILQVPYKELVVTADSEVWDAPIYGSGTAYVARDGQLYKIGWQRSQADQIVNLIGTDGKNFALKPGATFFEVVGSNSLVSANGSNWRITHMMP